MRLLLLLVTLLPQSPLPVQVPPTLKARFIEDMRTKDLDDVLSLYTADASLQDPRGHDISGQTALRKLFVDVFAAYDSDIALTESQHVAEGLPRHPTAIVEQGTYAEMLGDRHRGTATRVCGDYTFRYVPNPKGGWLIARMEWTTAPCS